MGLMDFIKRLLGGWAEEPFPDGAARRGGPYGRRARRARRRAMSRQASLGLMDLSRRLRLTASSLQSAPVRYNEFTIPKRSGGTRTILAPEPDLKELQRRLLHRLLARLKVHPAAKGFERRQSIVTNARPHVGSTAVVRMDIQDFFPSTATHRLREYFTAIGWDSEAVYLLLSWTTVDGGLPQGAPTSPRLSNLVNYEMDARLAGVAAKIGAVFTRYADDITFSFHTPAGRPPVAQAIWLTKRIVAQYGYRLHHKRKLYIRRRHESQRVTGLVVNDKVALPRRTRRRLRAIEHHLVTGRPATMTPDQLAGWHALAEMIERQRG